MKREEIEKAIENGESVWVNGIEHKLDKYYFVAEYNNEPTLYLMTCGYEEDDWNNYPVETITNIYKTKSEAEHYLHHANISRIEHLPFLTWEEFKEIGQISFIGKDKKEYILKKDIIWSNNKYTLVDCLKIVNETDFTFSKYFDYTEANFYKAYDECVRLFKGEKLSDIKAKIQRLKE